MSDGNKLQELPKGWMWTTVGDISKRIHYGYTESASESKVGPKFLRITDIQDNAVDWDSVPYCKISGEIKDKYLLKERDLVFARTGATVGKSFLLQGDIPEAVFASYLIRIVLHKDVDEKFIAYFFNSHLYWSQIHASKVGIGQPSVNGQVLSRIMVPFAPRTEQSRVVAKIDEQLTKLDAGVESLKKAHAQLKRYRQAVLNAAVTGELTREWREARRGELEPATDLLARILRERRAEWEAGQLAKMQVASKPPKDEDWKKKYQDPVMPDMNDRPHVPEGWVLTSLEAVTSAVRVICYGILMPKENVSDGVLYVKVKDMKGDRINLKDLHRTKPEIAAQYARASLRAGDLLLAIRGTYGRVVETPPELEGGNITQDTARLDVSKEVAAKYIALHLRSEESQNYFKRVARGVAVKGVNISEVRSTPILLPSFSEQQQIVSEVERLLSIVDATEQTIEQSLKQAERLRQSILQQAFAGKLVPQDPTDEPAEVLLARLKAEQSKNGGRAQRPRRAPRRQKRPAQPDMLP